MWFVRWQMWRTGICRFCCGATSVVVCTLNFRFTTSAALNPLFLFD